MRKYEKVGNYFYYVCLCKKYWYFFGKDEMDKNVVKKLKFKRDD